MGKSSNLCYRRTDRYCTPLNGSPNTETNDPRNQPGSKSVTGLFGNSYLDFDADWIHASGDSFDRMDTNNVSKGTDEWERMMATPIVSAGGLVGVAPTENQGPNTLPYDIIGCYIIRDYQYNDINNITISFSGCVYPTGIDPTPPVDPPVDPPTDPDININDLEFATENGRIIISDHNNQLQFEPEANTDTSNLSIV